MWEAERTTYVKVWRVRVPGILGHGEQISIPRAWDF